MTDFPTSLDNLTNPSAGDSMDVVDHAQQHADANDILESLEAKVGADSSAVTASHDYKLSNVSGSDKAVSLTGTETLTNKTMVAPALGTPVSGVATNLTGTASGLTAGNVTTNANLTGDVTSVGNATTISTEAVTAQMLGQPLSFHVRLSTELTSISTATQTKVPFDAETWDYGSHFDASGDNDFTAPYDGIYYFYLAMYVQDLDEDKYVEARIVSDGLPGLARHREYSSGAERHLSVSTVSQIMLEAGDTVTANIYHNNGDSSIEVDAISLTYFGGYLVGRF